MGHIESRARPYMSGRLSLSSFLFLPIRILKILLIDLFADNISCSRLNSLADLCARRQWNLHTKLSSSTLISSVLTYSRHCSRQNQSLMTECAVRKYAFSNVRGDSHAFGIHPTSSLPKHQRLAHLIVHMQHYGLFMQDQALNLLYGSRHHSIMSCLRYVFHDVLSDSIGSLQRPAGTSKALIRAMRNDLL